MEWRESLESARESLQAHALRSALAMLGIIFGVGAVIAMLSIGAGAEQEALALIDTMGMRNILIRSKEPRREDELVELRRKSVGLAPRDTEAIVDAIPGVEGIVQKIAIEPYMVMSATGRVSPEVYGVSSSFGALMGVQLAEGRFLDARDEATHAQVCVIGDALRRELFGLERAVGEALKVNEQWLTVIGVMASRGTGGNEVGGVRIVDTAGLIYLPVTTARSKFPTLPHRSPLDEIVVRMSHGTPVQESAASIDSLLERLHSGAGDYALVVPEALLEQSRRTQRIFDIVMGCIAGISLLVGGIGIMNIMLATVLERTREIGVRRALGARRTDIRTQFLIEALVISVGGGLAGVGMGVAIAKIVALSAGWQTIVTPFSIILAAGVSMAVGLGFGIYPAIRAAELDPIEALRHE